MLNKDKIQKIIKFGRFNFLAGGFFIYTIGILLAIISGAEFSLELFIFGYAIFLPAHLSMNYSNNYFDIESDKYNRSTSISGGSKLLIQNPELKKTILLIFSTLLAISIILALIFTIIYQYSYFFFLLVIIGNMLGLFYAAPPIRLSYRTLGEISLIVTLGLIMPGFGYWILKGGLDIFYFVFAIGLFLIGLVFIIIVQIPDMEGDIKGNKKTLVVRLGRKRAYIVILVTLFLTSVYYLLLSSLGIFNNIINYMGIYFITLIPFIIALKGWFKKPFKKKIATSIAIKNMISIIIFFALVNLYLILNIVI